jgi:hypothetical protein
MARGHVETAMTRHPCVRWLEAQVSTEPEKKARLHGALADGYEPTEADADRVFAKSSWASAKPTELAKGASNGLSCGGEP